jgi:hypothetical protein
MSNVIDFLEQMGRDAQLRCATGLEVEAALIGAGIEPRVRAAILGGDQLLLESLVGASRNICSMINVPEEEEDDHGADEEKDGKQDRKQDRRLQSLGCA